MTILIMWATENTIKNKIKDYVHNMLYGHESVLQEKERQSSTIALSKSLLLHRAFWRQFITQQRNHCHIVIV